VQRFPTLGMNQDIEGYMKKNRIMAEKGTYINSVRQDTSQKLIN